MRSINTKLTLAFLFTSLVSVVFAVVLISVQTRYEFGQFVSSSDKGRISDELGEFAEDNSWSRVDEYIDNNNFLNAFQDQIIVLDADHIIVFSQINGYSVGQIPVLEETSDITTISHDGQTLGYVVFSFQDGQFPQFSLEAEFLQQIGIAVVASAGVAIGIAFIIGGLLAQTLSRPIKEFTQATRALSQGDLGTNVEVRSKDEIGELAVAFNQMSDNLDRAVQYRKQVTADVAHDLRTPLTILGTYTEGLIDGTLENKTETFQQMKEEVVYLQRLVEDLRTLSLADAGELALERTLVEPKALLERVGLRNMMVAEKKGLSLDVKAAESLPKINVDIDRMTQVLDNLTTNALHHTSAGGLSLIGEGDEDRIRLIVQDTGAGIAPEDIPFVFDRFYRADKSRQRSGDGRSGLGLAISKAIVDAHGGKIKVESKVGNGSKFIIEFPAN